MSFLFGSSKALPANEPKLFGAQKERVDSNESGRVLPWFAGTRWMGVTWVGDVFGVKTTPITEKVGKKRQTVGYNYYASFAGLVSAGPVDRITKIRFDDEVVWSGIIDRDDTDFVTITIENRGNVHFHWGTETQTYHALLSGSGQNHSSYRGQCYLIGEQILLGPDRTTVPNIQVEVGRVGRPSWFPVGFWINHDVNPIIPLWEWWTDHRYGLGRSEDELDLDSLSDAASQLASEDLGVSPMLTTEDDMKNLLVRLFEYFDGYPTSTDGKLGVELARPTTGTVSTIGDTSLINDPEIETQQWTETFDEVRVKFPDYEKEGGENLAKIHERANFLITGRHKALNVDRQWATRHAVAWTIAGALARVSGSPQSRGRLQLRESSAASVTLGSVFDLQTRDGQLMRMRCTERTEPSPDRRFVDIGFVSDAGWANLDVTMPTADTIPATPVYAPDAPYEATIQDAPYAVAYSQTLASLLWLVARGDDYSTGYDVWKASAQGGPYSAASDRRGAEIFSNFAVRAKLSADYSDDTFPIDDTTGISFEILSPDDDLLDDEWDQAAGLNHELLAFVGDEATEIMALYDVTPTSATTYTAKTVRGLYDTERKSHASGAKVWIQLRSKLDKDAWPPFSESERYYKFQTHFGVAELSLADVDPVAHTENARSLLPLPPKNLRANGDGEHPTWTSGNDVVVAWSNSSRARSVFGLPLNESPATDLSGISLELRSYDGATLYDTTEVSPTGEQTTLTSAYLVTNVNADFMVRSYGLRNGLKSLNYDQIQVRKV